MWFRDPPHGGACAGCSLRGASRGLLLSVKVTSPCSKPSGTFIFNPSHEQFPRHILVLKGHRQGEPAPLRLVGWSCCQAARAGAAWSPEQPHPSSPRGVAHQELPGCWQGPQWVPAVTAAELHAGTPRPRRERSESSQAGCSQEDGVFSPGSVPGTAEGREFYKLKQRKFCLNMRKNFFPLRVTEPWPGLPREAVESPSLEIFKTRLDKVLCSLLWVTLLGQGVGLGDPQRSLPTPTIL